MSAIDANFHQTYAEAMRKGLKLAETLLSKGKWSMVGGGGGGLSDPKDDGLLVYLRIMTLPQVSSPWIWLYKIGTVDFCVILRSKFSYLLHKSVLYTCTSVQPANLEAGWVLAFVCSFMVPGWSVCEIIMVIWSDFLNIGRHKIINTALNTHAHIHVRMSYLPTAHKCKALHCMTMAAFCMCVAHVNKYLGHHNYTEECSMFDQGICKHCCGFYCCMHVHCLWQNRSHTEFEVCICTICNTL